MHRRFDTWATTYDRGLARFFFRRVHREVLGVLHDQALPPGIVLDVGCGTGELLGRVARQVAGRNAVGVDASSGMLRVAVTKPASGRCAVGSASALPLRDAIAALVVTTVSFHHWDDQDAGLAEVARVLAPGGRLLMADFFASGPLGIFMRRRHHGAGFRSVGELLPRLARVGLRVAEVRRLGPPASPLRILAAGA
ncbi:MAG: class I SAM-dependent methyltransferase [Acidimicrobiales bacterium]